MPGNHARATLLWTILSDALDIPKSLYQRAAERHRAVGEWLCRAGSALARYRPNVRPQGSFRFGTVVRPMVRDAEYDLDHVVVLEALDTRTMSQHGLKALLGAELTAYAEAHGMRAPTEHNRCWRLHYRDEVPFHLDSLPCVPADTATYLDLRRAGVEEQWASRAVSITDKRRANYAAIDPHWLTSNPRGFARWFESRASQGRDRSLLDAILGGRVEDVPPYEWRTPLQRSIQLLKRHRDVVFGDEPDLAPISMIITNLATQAYGGEGDLTDALRGIVERMPRFVLRSLPRVPNPTHPNEDYADRWSRNPLLEPNFWAWHAQVQADVERLSAPLTHLGSRDILRPFKVQLSDDDERRLSARAPAVVTSAATAPRIEGAVKPWGSQ